MTFRTSIVDGAQGARKKVPGFVASLPPLKECACRAIWSPQLPLPRRRLTRFASARAVVARPCSSVFSALNGR